MATPADRTPFPPRPANRFPDRPPFRGPGGSGRPPDTPPPPHSLRLRDGEREIDVSGSPAFVRQILDDLPALLARLRGESAPTPPSIRMPAPPRAADSEAATVARADPVAAAAPDPAPSVPRVAGRSLDDRVFDLLGGAGRPLAISAIRERLDEPATGQQVRRILERAGNRVVASGDRPMRYRLRG